MFEWEMPQRAAPKGSFIVDLGFFRLNSSSPSARIRATNQMQLCKKLNSASGVCSNLSFGQ